MYNKCISLWLIVLTIIMTFCVSHQNQLDDDNKANYTSDDTNVFEAVQTMTASIENNISMTKSSIEDSPNLGEYILCNTKEME